MPIGRMMGPAAAQLEAVISQLRQAAEVLDRVGVDDTIGGAGAVELADAAHSLQRTVAILADLRTALSPVVSQRPPPRPRPGTAARDWQASTVGPAGDQTP